MTASPEKRLGQYYTPPQVASSLIRAVVRSEDDRVLDPSCGNGQFLQLHPGSVGVDISREACAWARLVAPHAMVHESDFFAWAEQTEERFDCVVGNPPFIRYQRFCGEARARALRLSRQAGVRLTALTSSWVPFVAVPPAFEQIQNATGQDSPGALGYIPRTG